MAAEVRERIMALLAQEPQTPSILRQVEFLERDLARLETPTPQDVAFREEVVALRRDLVTAVVQEIRDAMRPAVAVDNFQPASPRAQMLRLEYNKNCGCRRRRKFQGAYLGRLLCRHSSPSFHVLEWGGM